MGMGWFHVHVVRRLVCRLVQLYRPCACCPRRCWQRYARWAAASTAWWAGLVVLIQTQLAVKHLPRLLLECCACRNSCAAQAVLFGVCWCMAERAQLSFQVC